MTQEQATNTKRNYTDKSLNKERDDSEWSILISKDQPSPIRMRVLFFFRNSKVFGLCSQYTASFYAFFWCSYHIYMTSCCNPFAHSVNKQWNHLWECKDVSEPGLACWIKSWLLPFLLIDVQRSVVLRYFIFVLRSRSIKGPQFKGLDWYTCIRLSHIWFGTLDGCSNLDSFQQTFNAVPVPAPVR